MTWYIEIVKWIIIVFILGAICKYIVPKKFWAWLELKIVEWQLSSTTKHFETMSYPKKKYKIFFMVFVALASFLFGFFFVWWYGIIAFIIIYFIGGLILMQMGLIE